MIPYASNSSSPLKTTHSETQVPISLWWGKRISLCLSDSQAQRIMIIGLISTVLIGTIGFFLGGALAAGAICTGGFLLTLKVSGSASGSEYKSWLEQKGGRGDLPVVYGEIDDRSNQASITFTPNDLIDKTKVVWKNRLSDDTIALISIDRYPALNNEGEIKLFSNPKFNGYNFSVSINRNNSTEKLILSTYQEEFVSS